MTLPVLPVEIWRQIVKGNLHTKPDLLALTLTSSLFLPISQEALYDDVSLTRSYRDDEDEESSCSDEEDGGYSDEERGCNDTGALELFARSVKERPELARLVRHLRVSYKYEWALYFFEEDVEQRRLLDSFTNHPILSNLAWFTMLRHLYLERFLVDPTLLSALKSHPRLTSIEFKQCGLSETLFCTNPSLDWSESCISAVSINHTKGSHMRAWAAVCPAGMRTLEFADDDPLVVDGTFSSLLPGVTISLTTLSLVSYTLPPNFSHFLTGTPQLRRLKLPHIEPDMELLHRHPLPRDIIPFLEHFQGPADLCGKFIRGRPVHSLKLKFEHDTSVDILITLQLSAAPVTKLRFYFVDLLEDRHYKYLMHSPISIKSFGWDGLMYPKDHALYCQALSRLTSLAVITLSLSWIPPDNRRRNREQTVHEYYQACPSLQEVCFREERWRLRKQGGWERLIDLL